MLLHLDRLGPMSQRRLIDVSGEDKSAMVRTVDDLERLGLAERHPDPADRRAYAVEITDRGRAVRAAAAARAESAQHMFATITPDECDTLVKLSQKLVGATMRSTSSSSARVRH